MVNVKKLKTTDKKSRGILTIVMIITLLLLLWLTGKGVIYLLQGISDIF